MEKKEPKHPNRETALSYRANAGESEEMAEQLKTMIREMPQIEPPARLLTSVMETVKTKKRPFWFRAYRWARSPRTITFTPLLPVTVMALSAILVFSVFFLHESKNRNITLAESRKSIPVEFALDMPDARSVYVVGSFNHWVPQPCLLHKDNDSTRWLLTLQLQPGRYEYAFIVDGKRVPNPETGFNQDDGFGNKNSVLALGKEDDI